MLLALDTDQGLTEHSAPAPILVQVLAGRADFTAEGRTVELRPGGIIHLNARIPHAVIAREPSHVLLTLLDAVAENQPVQISLGQDA
jgi:quercetin dioxygenase-like cupin family protein